jgi:hypothetical protein
MFNDLMPHEVAIVGVFAWVSLIVFIARRIRVPGDVMPRSLPNPVPDAQLPPEQGLPARE